MTGCLLESDERADFKQRFEDLLCKHDIPFQRSISPSVWDLGLPPTKKIIGALNQKQGWILTITRVLIASLFSIVLLYSFEGLLPIYPEHDALAPFYSLMTQQFPQSLFVFFTGYPTTSVMIVLISIFFIYLDGVLLWSSMKPIMNRIWLWSIITVLATLVIGTIVGVGTDIILLQLALDSSEITSLWVVVLLLLGVMMPISQLTILRRFTHYCVPEVYDLGQRLRSIRKCLYGTHNPVGVISKNSNIEPATRAYSHLRTDILARLLAVFIFGFFPAMGIQFLFQEEIETVPLATSFAMVALASLFIVVPTIYWVTTIKKRELDVHLASTSILFLILLGCLCVSLVNYGFILTLAVQIIGIVCIFLLLEMAKYPGNEKPKMFGWFYYSEVLNHISIENARQLVEETFASLMHVLK